MKAHRQEGDVSINKNAELKKSSNYLEEYWSWGPSQKSLKTAIKKIVDAINSHLELLAALPFESLSGCESNLLGESDLDIGELAYLLDPHIPNQRNRIDQLASKLKSTIPEHLSTECEQLCDDADSIRFDMLHAGYHIGILMGARKAGASDNEMKKLAQGLFKTIITQPCNAGNR